VFFNAIRMAWNNFTKITGGDQSGFSSARTTLRNADVVWLENWNPSVYIGPFSRVEMMTFDHAEVLDIHARARTLQQLIRWEDEGAVVERWIENSLSAKDGREPSRLALGRYLKGRWSRELERQDGLRHSKPFFIACSPRAWLARGEQVSLPRGTNRFCPGRNLPVA
jgi:hypothetical protein